MTDEDGLWNEAERPSAMFPVALGSQSTAPLTIPIAKAPTFPANNPKEYNLKEDPMGIEFDPTIHLTSPLEIPQNIRILQLNEEAGTDCVKLVTMPTESYFNTRKKFTEDLAYTEPFRVLSDEGVKAFRSIIEHNEEEMAIVTPRNPKIIRGLGFTSKFVRDLNESPDLLHHLSRFANVDIAAHPMTTNYSQINFGEPPMGEEEAKPADVWHLDSVDYVLVIMLTDDFEGGELLVSHIDPNQAMERIRTNTLPDELITKNKYPGPGYGIFMQGCRIAHAVAPLTAGSKSSRITAVNSYASCDSMRIDRPSIYNALSQNHTKQVYDPDYLRLIAWRCMSKLNHLVTDPQYDNPRDGDDANNMDILDLVIDQLTMARALMGGEEKHKVPLSQNINLEQGGFHCAAEDQKL